MVAAGCAAMMPTDPQDEAAARWVVDRHAPVGSAMVQIYPGPPREAAEAFAAASRRIEDEIVAVTWADGAIVAVYRRRPEYDFIRLLFGIVAAIILAYAGYLMADMRSVSGDTLAEAFYHAVGFIAWGLAVLSVAVGLRRS